MSFFNTWQFNLIGYLITIVLFFQFYKITTKHSTNDTVLTITLQLTAGFTAFLFSLFVGFKLPSEPVVYLLLTAACLIYALNNILQTKAIKNLPISLYTIVNQLTTVFLIIYGIFIFKEPLIYNKIFGALLILFGNLLVLYQKGLKLRNKFIYYGIATAFTFSVALSIDISISDQFSLPGYLFITFSIPALILLITNRISIKKLNVEFIKNRQSNFILLTGIFWFLVPFFGIRAIQLGSVTTVVPLQAVSVLLNILVATLFLGEKENILRKVSAAVLVIIGVSLTVLN